MKANESSKKVKKPKKEVVKTIVEPVIVETPVVIEDENTLEPITNEQDEEDFTKSKTYKIGFLAFRENVITIHPDSTLGINDKGITIGKAKGTAMYDGVPRDFTYNHEKQEVTIQPLRDLVITK